MGRRWVHIFAATLASLAGASALFAGSAAAVGGRNPLADSNPATYIANYDHRSVAACNIFFSPDFVAWLTYADANFGGNWDVRASNQRLCHLADTTAKQLPGELPFLDGTGISKANMEGYALAAQQSLTSRGVTIHQKHSVPKGWKCFALPSQWGEDAFFWATVDGSGPSFNEFAAASGAAAGAGYCETGAKFSKKDRAWHHGSFFDWVPDPQACLQHYQLNQEPDPNNPGMTRNIPYPQAQPWSSYSQVPC